MRRPDFFIVGAAKSGTSSLSYYLRQHPEVFLPPRELHFFGSDLDFRRDIRTEEQYLSYFSHCSVEARVGEKSVSYLYSSRAAKEIKAFCTDAHIIIMLRNPVDMIYSLHSHLVREGSEDIHDFASALAAENARRSGSRVPKNTPNPHWLLYREVAKYAEQVRRYLDIFGGRNIKVVIYEDFAERGSGVYRDILEFLGVDDTFQPDLGRKNANKGVRSELLHRALTRIIVRPPMPVLGAARRLLPAGIRRSLRSTLLGLNLEPKPRRPIDPDLRRRLQFEFSHEVRRVSQLLGRDLTFWIRG